MEYSGFSENVPVHETVNSEKKLILKTSSFSEWLLNHLCFKARLFYGLNDFGLVLLPGYRKNF